MAYEYFDKTGDISGISSLLERSLLGGGGRKEEGS